MRKTLATILLLLTITALVTSCKDEVTSVVKHATDPEEVPTMSTRDVQTIISDNGHTRYRISTPLWNMYEESKEPHWVFPKGVKAEEMDSAYHVVTTIKCDSAYYDEAQQLWDLRGNVHITSGGGADNILTNQLYWNQIQHKLYSNEFIHVEKQGRVIEGYGYESDEHFATYTLRKVEAIFPVDESKMPHPGGKK